MFQSNFFLNPKRRGERTGFRGFLRSVLTALPVRMGLWLGFENIDYSYVHGDRSRLQLGKNCSTMNTLFNVISGTIAVGDDTLFAHGCMVLTGTHQFFDGKRGALHDPPIEETPTSGRDVRIGSGCFIGSGAIIVGPVTIGDHVIICAGAVVVKDVPDHAVVAGVPARPLPGRQ